MSKMAENTYPNEKEAPPAYSGPPQGQMVGNGHPQPRPQQQSQWFRFPQTFGIYHASGSSSDLRISLSKDSPTLNYVSTHTGWSSQPSVILHSGPTESTPPLATADFRAMSRTIDLTLHAAVPNPQNSTLTSSGFIPARTFTAPIPSTSSLESFEWKRSQGHEVQLLEGRSHGKKCVRMSTGEVVAVWTAPDMSWGKKGKVAFLGDRAALGEAFEVLCLVSLLAVWEKERRSKRSSSGAAGGGAAAC